ncbi:TetR/AcrR family transcriptional regulator [Mangrovicoccus algicola]|uniref:TetR/AcrR family transcriptional regulator C-terminal ligand-binding domain-containing protein n=1 Tax=Mangrovicoccus algicola TaxID=2771008 RepID=A0A8J6Z5N9_9RHOB|nr:TetR-like C-terminal domain-containing protein [Mangrovicoccus algicola]MBE3636800.1 TetR/AcrR family transcriptional regulator C-terminal ligand-binding domain-containing protein [Mangrovicoccus algicola]
MGGSEARRPKAGRPPDRQAGRAVRQAALQLMREKGYAGVSIAAIAARAGVARQTLYNRWPTKADLVLDAVFEETGRNAPALPGGAPPEGQAGLEAFLLQVLGHLQQDGDPLRALIAAAQHDPVFRDALRARFVLPRERIVTDLLIRAQARGEIAAHRDPGLLSQLVHGIFWYRLLNGQELDAALAREIAAEIFGR